MTPAVAVALLLATALPGGLDEARRAFAAGDHASAERLALEAAAAGGPGEAEARYLAALARFRAGRPAEALDLLDAAAAGADSAAAWHFNRGACLYELGRSGEAEAAFLEAARDPAFESLALVNAGFAALDGGDAARATALAARARAVASGPATELVEELERALAAPSDPISTATPTSSSSSTSTSTSTSSSSSERSPFSFGGGAEVGYDDDALRAGTGAVERPGTVAQVGSGVATAWLGGEGRLALGGLTLAAGYGVAQVAYQAAAAEDYGTQQHDLQLALRGSPAEVLRLELALLGQYALAGRTSLRGLQASGGARLTAALEAAAGQVTRAEVSLAAKEGQGAEFASLDGSRLEAAASHEARWGRLTASGGYRFRLERLGVVSSAAPAPPGGGTAADVERLSYAGHTGWLALRLEPRPWLRLDLLGGLEWRLGLSDLVTVVTTPEGTQFAVAARRRTDLRGFGGEAAALQLTGWLTLTLRHEWLASRTWLSATRTSPGMAQRGAAVPTWDKNVFTLGLSAAW